MGAPGCDDAPVVTMKYGQDARDFTLVMPYYENPRFLAHQIRHWNMLSLRKHLHVNLVDDGSPRNAAANVVATFVPAVDMRLFRIEIDVRWNWLAARNIGVHKATTEWVMLTDMDHVLSNETLETLVRGQHDPSIIYRFSRSEHHGADIHPHPNSWFMTRDMFWKVGGYDEALSGFYGTDGEYRRRCAATAKVQIMADALIRHEYIQDSSTTLYKRKQPEDAEVKRKIRARGPGWKPRTLSFPYHEVKL